MIDLIKKLKIYNSKFHVKANLLEKDTKLIRPLQYLDMTEKQKEVLNAFESLEGEWITLKELAEILLYPDSTYISADIKCLLGYSLIEGNNKIGKYKKYRICKV